MGKIRFGEFHKPLITTMIQERTPEAFIATARNAVCRGTEAIGFQICQMEPEYRTEENFRRMFAYAEDKPIYVTNYNMGFNVKTAPEKLAEGLLLALKAGATLADVPGDLYKPDRYQLTRDRDAVKKQKELIEKIHELGGEALVSSHIFEYRSAQELLEVAREQESRGADVLKFVTESNTEEELAENIRTGTFLKKELKKPFLFLSRGKYCKIHRMIAPYFGSCMWLCVYQYGILDNKDQPLLRQVKAVTENFDYKPNMRDA